MKTPLIIVKLMPGKKIGLVPCDMTNDTVEVQVDRRNIAGNLVYPYIYQIKCDDAVKYPKEWHRGRQVYAVPLRAFKKLAKRAELELQPAAAPDPGDRIPANDPRIEPWKKYL